MSNSGNDWNSFMQSRPARLVLNALCTVICAYYVVDGVREMMSPERSAVLIEQLGPTAYYALTVVRILVCIWVSVVFGRMTWKTFNEQDPKE